MKLFSEQNLIEVSISRLLGHGGGEERPESSKLEVLNCDGTHGSLPPWKVKSISESESCLLFELDLPVVLGFRLSPAAGWSISDQTYIILDPDDPYIFLLPRDNNHFESIFHNLGSRPGDSSFHLYMSGRALANPELSLSNRMVAFSVFCYKSCELGNEKGVETARSFYEAYINSAIYPHSSRHPRKDLFHLQCSCLCAFMHLAACYGLQSCVISVINTSIRLALTADHSFYTAAYPLSKSLSVAAYLSARVESFFVFRILATLVHFIYVLSVCHSDPRAYTMYEELKFTHASSSSLGKALALSAHYGIGEPNTSQAIDAILANSLRVGSVTAKAIQASLDNIIRDSRNELEVELEHACLVVCDHLSLDSQIVNDLRQSRNSLAEARLFKCLLSSDNTGQITSAIL